MTSQVDSSPPQSPLEIEQGPDALALAALDSRPTDCLLLDLHMPGLNGFDVLETFRSRQITVPVIVITAHDEPGTREQAESLGACAYLKKPVDRDALLAAIEAAKPAPNPGAAGS